MVKLRSNEFLKLIVTLFVMFFRSIESLEGGLTIIESAVAKGAVCLDGSPPAYQMETGFGDGVNNWLVHIQGGGWCDSVEDCVNRKTMYKGLGSSKLMFEMNFTGILSNNKDQNPYLYDWNRVIMRYCDGSSFTGDVEEVDLANKLYFRGARIFNAIVEELMGIGMKDAQNAILSGCSAGGLASILHCDKFRGFFPSSTRVKCVTDGGYFAHAKDLSGEYHFEQYYDNVVRVHGSAKNLPSECTSNMNPGLCFYPQFAIPYIKTPVFVMNSAYDTWQVHNILALSEADPKHEFTSCKMDLSKCSTTQLKRLEVHPKECLSTLVTFIANLKTNQHGLETQRPNWMTRPLQRELVNGFTTVVRSKRSITSMFYHTIVRFGLIVPKNTIQRYKNNITNLQNGIECPCP